MSYLIFYFTQSNSYDEIMKIEKLHPSKRDWSITLEDFLEFVKVQPNFVSYFVNNEYEYEEVDFSKTDYLKWRSLKFYLKNNLSDFPSGNVTCLFYDIERNSIGAASYKNRIDDWIILYEIAGKLGFKLYCSYLNKFITLEYIDSLKEKSKSKGPKLTQKQEDVLSEVDNDAAWIYIPTDKTQEIISYLSGSSKENEIVSGLYKAFEKDFTGLATYQSHSILFGKNLMTLSLPELKNSSKPINDDDLQKIMWNLSIRFGEAQFYSYNKYEVWYIHYRNGALVYSGTNGDDGPFHIIGSITEEIELSESKVKELAEANGIGIEDFLIGCMKNKIKCHLIEAKNGMQVWWDGIMNDVNKAMKEDKKKKE